MSAVEIVPAPVGTVAIVVFGERGYAVRYLARRVIEGGTGELDDALAAADVALARDLGDPSAAVRSAERRHPRGEGGGGPA